MAEDDGWRQQAAEARHGALLIPGFARDPVRKPATIRPSTVQNGNSVGLGQDCRPVFDPTPKPTPLSVNTPPYRSSRHDSKRIGWTLASLVMLVLAGAIGWFVQPIFRQQVYAHSVTSAAHIAAPIAAARLPVSPVAIAEPSAPVAVVQTIGGHSPAFQETITHAPHLTADLRPIEQSHGGSRPADAASSPRSDRSTPSQAPSSVVETKGRPSFECRANQGTITASICNDHTLAVLDRRLATRFAALDASVDPAAVEALHHGETTFLNARQLCSDKACLAEVYRQRLGELEGIKP